MTPEQFAYWLQGFAELNGAPPSDAQWQSIREHLATVFTKVTPEVVLPTFDPNRVSFQPPRSPIDKGQLAIMC